MNHNSGTIRRMISRGGYSIVKRPEFLILACVGLEALFLCAFFDLHKWPLEKGDGIGYHNLAVNFLDRGTFSMESHPPYEPTIVRTPGYPLFIAFVYLVSGGSFLALRLAQLALLGLTSVLVYKIGLRVVSRNAAVLAGVLCGTYPPFVFQAAHHLTETLALVLGALFVLLLMRATEIATGTRRDALTLGLVAGAGTLVRPSFACLIAVPVLAFFFSRWGPSQPSRGKAVLLAVLGFVICIGPWTVRNAIVSREFVPLGATSGMSFFYSMQQYANEVSYRITNEEWANLIRDDDRRVDAAALQVDQTADLRAGVPRGVVVELLTNRQYTSDGLQQLRHMGISLIIGNVPARLACLWGPGDSSPWAAGTLFHGFVQTQFVILSLLVLSGLYLSRWRLMSHWPLWILPLYLTAVHFIFNAEPRYTYPARPFMLIYAAFALERVASFLVRSRRKLRLA